MKKVSIILPIYNGEKYLNKCINSVLNQTYENIELICINDGSKDKTLNVLQSYKDHRIKIIDKNNSGVSDTRNLGLSNATGDYVAFIDVDDFYDKQFVEKMVFYIQKYNADAVRCNYEVINSNDNLIEKGNLNFYSNKKYDDDGIKKIILPLLLKGTIPCFSCLLLIKREKIKNVYFPTNIHMMEDVVFYIDLLTQLKSLYICDDILYTIMYNDKGATNLYANYERNILDIIEINKNIKNIIREKRLSNKLYIENINVNNLNAISDFIFKYYLFSKKEGIKLCKKLSDNNDFIDILDTSNLSEIQFQRRKILAYIQKKSFTKLNIYFKIRKLIFKLRRII